MNARYITPTILCGVAIGQIKRGEDGLAIAIIIGVAVMLLTMYVLDEIDEARKRKSRNR